MKIVLIGARGTIGKAVAAELAAKHEVIAVGRKSGKFQVDFSDLEGVRDLFKKAGKVDAIVSTAGNVHFGPLAKMTPELFEVGLNDKLMGQVNLVLAGQDALNDGGSITLTAGTLSENPILQGSSASMVNGALESFVRAAAIELPRGLRINAVSPDVVQESLGAFGAFFPGHEGVPAKRAAMFYVRSVEGAQTGRVYRVE